MAIPHFCRSWRVPLFLATSFILALFYKHLKSIATSQNTLTADPHSNAASTAVVVAALSKDDVGWIDFPGWEVWKYEVDSSTAKHSTPKNKGHEATVYLTHIIDQYDNLAERLIFIHSGRYQWHNDDTRYDGKRTLQRLRLEYIDEQGYVNLRCHWFQGCPAELKLSNASDPANNTNALEQVYADTFHYFFPTKNLPEVVAAGCCSQFAVTAGVVRQNSREDYIRIRDWLLETETPDYITGRVLEYSWHILFGKSAVHCPPADECYCKTFGKCNLQCTEGDCGQYQYPFGIDRMKTLSWKLRHAFD